MTPDCSDSTRRAYPEAYLPDAMEALAAFFDYAVNDYGAEAWEVARLLASSRLGAAFEAGSPRVVSGKSGPELFAALSEEKGYGTPFFIEPVDRANRTPAYWAGWVSAFCQWRLDIPFRLLFSVMPIDETIALYHPWHEASEERFAQLVLDRLQNLGSPTNLARLRQNLHLTQSDLARASGVSLRSIQMYEQRNKDINKAQAQTVAQLARALHCPMEHLLEPHCLGATQQRPDRA